MNKVKKSLTILIEEPITENAEENNLTKLISALNKIKIDQSPTLVKSIHQRYQDEIVKLSSLNNSHLTQLMEYLEGEIAKQLPFIFHERNLDFHDLNKCMFLSTKQNESTANKDFSLEFNVLKLLTDNQFNKSRLLSLSKNLKSNNRYSDIVPCKDTLFNMN